MTDRSAPPRPHYPIWSTGPGAAKIGEVASGTQSPSLGIGIGMGYVPPAFAKARYPARDRNSRQTRAGGPGAQADLPKTGLTTAQAP